MVWFIESDKSLTIFFFYVYASEVKSLHLCSELYNLLHSLELISHILENNSHFTQKL